MNILVLNGSPRPKANTKAHIEAFKEGAEAKGHSVRVFNVGNMKINGCLGCEYCHTKGDGACVQKDDMQEIYPYLAQMMSLITRFYAPGRPAADKYALFLSSGSPGVYDAPVSEYKSILKFFGATNMGIITAYGDQNQSEEKLKEFKDFGLSL